MTMTSDPKKHCSKCGDSKPVEQFGQNKRKKDGLQPLCKPCHCESVKAQYRKDPDKVKRRAAQWCEDNRSRSNAIKRRWIDNNKGKHRALVAKRQAAKLDRTIPLAPEHEAAIKHIYAFAKYISEKTKITHHVDHIVPLQGKEMTGLHVPWNLQVVSARQNLVKSNKVDYSRALPTCMD